MGGTMDRRNAMKTIAMASAASFLSLPAFAAAKETGAAEALSPKALSFDPKKLDGISEKMILSHWENNYGGSVKTLNAVNKKLSAAMADKDFPAFSYNGLKREHLMRTGSVVFHELYFDNLGGNGKAEGLVANALAKSFGSVNAWEAELRRIAQGLGGGSGWAVLGYNYHLKRLENYWAADHMHAAAGSMPLLVMDMYEHSYQIDYGATAGKYIDAFFRNVNWEAVEKRYDRAMKWA
jgi:Fe-Mn family superoxide dismutase